MKLNLLIITLLFPFIAQANSPFSVVPAQPADTLNFPTVSPITINLVNSSLNPESAVLTLSNNLFSVLVNRCSTPISKQRSCYVIVFPNLKNMSAGVNSAQLFDGSNTLLNLTYNHSPVVNLDSIQITPTVMDLGVVTTLNDTVQQQITLTNTGTNAITPYITKSSKISIVLNRCQNISLSPNKSCIIYFKMIMAGSDPNAVITTEFIKFKPSISSLTEVTFSPVITTNLPIFAESSYAYVDSGSVRSIDNGYIAHATVGAIHMNPRKNNGRILTSGDKK